MPAQASAQMSNRQLQQAFALFNQVSDELGSTWRELETRVADLTAELSATRSARLRELAEKEKLADKLSTLMAALPSAVLVLDTANRVEECNPAAEAIFGADLYGRCWEDIAAQYCVLPVTTDGEFETHSGRRLAAVSSQLAQDDARIVQLTDITQSHELSRVLHREQRLRELGDVAARLAHQLRTPLSSAMLYLTQLDSIGDDPQKAGLAGSRIRERLSHIERLIEGMLAYIQGSTVSRACLSLNQLVVEVCDAMQAQVIAAGGTLQWSLPESDLQVMGQSQALFEALSNLVDNALQSAGEDVVIRIELRARGGLALLSVADNGPGIEAGARERIFDPYFSTRAHGTGLGLAVVASALQSHGGDVSVSESENGGACFKLRIPLVGMIPEDE